MNNRLCCVSSIECPRSSKCIRHTASGTEKQDNQQYFMPEHVGDNCEKYEDVGDIKV